MNYRIPNNLLSTKNSKTIKGEKFGYTTYIMYLAPHKQNSLGKNLCSHASEGCAKACLFKSGAARFDQVQAGKVNKANFFIEDRTQFIIKLYTEITAIVKRHEAIQGEAKYKPNGDVLRYKKFAIRLNGTSDIPFENIPIKGLIFNWDNIFEMFPDVQFYDYTKNHKRFDNVILPKNYQLTFSRSEVNHKETIDILQRGYNVAVVFGVKDVNELPETYLGYSVINGDESDLRFLDKENVVVGLKYKLMTGKGTKGMNKVMVEDNDFIVNVEDIARQEQAYIGMKVFDKLSA